MSENTNQPATNAKGQAQQQYVAEELNIGVWWTMKSLKEKSSLSVNMIDKGLKFRSQMLTKLEKRELSKECFRKLLFISLRPYSKQFLQTVSL